MSSSRDSFQCFVCENCPTLSEIDKKFLKECGDPPAAVTTKAPLLIPTTTTQASDEVEEEDYSEEEEDDESFETKDLPATSSTTSSTSTSISTSTSTSTSTPTSTSTSSSPNPSTSTSTTSPTTPSTSTALNSTSQSSTEAQRTESDEVQTSAESTTSQQKKKGDNWSFFPRSMDEEDFIKNKEDLTNGEDFLEGRQLPGTRPACFVLRMNYDGNEVVNRGCGSAVEDRNLSCKMLSKGQPYLDCEICEEDMCNGHIDEGVIVSGVERLRTAIIIVLLNIVLFAFNKW